LRLATVGVSASAFGPVLSAQGRPSASTPGRLAVDTASTNPHVVPGVKPVLETTRLTDSLSVISGAGGNVVVAVGPDSVLLVNGGHASRALALLDEVSKLSGGKPVRTLFNTEWHPEHTGANDAVGKAGGAIVAHEFTKQYLSTEMTIEWQGVTHKARERQALPTKTFYAKGSMAFDDEQIEYAHLGQAHTDGDIYVHFKNANVLVAGDELAVGQYPIADYNSGGWLGGMVIANKAVLDATDAQTRYVPGVGPVQARAGLQAQHDMLAAMRDRLHKAFRQGMGIDDMLGAGLTKDFDAAWGNPEQFIAVSYRGMWLHIRELGGVV
jgi:glyoxylase-like metal-dependent hydrolase (beta-lactamase superfamily II)